jgi:DNA-binding MurR/RpiR family transcriptional regulator
VLHEQSDQFSRDQLAALSPTERRVAEFLTSSGAEALVLSAAAIAERLGTSDATVVRTAQALGYSGLSEMRRALASRSPDPLPAQRLQRTLADTPADQMLTASVANHLAGVDSLTQRVTPDIFQRAVQILGGGKRIVWRGVGPSASLAEYAALLCQRVGRPSSSWTRTGTSFADELLQLERGDVVAVLAYGRVQTDVHVLLDHATNLGSDIVLLTDSYPHQIADQVALILESGRGIPGLFASHTTTLVLMEALVLGLAATDPSAAQDSLAQLNDLRAALAGRRLDVDTP